RLLAPVLAGQPPARDDEGGHEDDRQQPGSGRRHLYRQPIRQEQRDQRADDHAAGGGAQRIETQAIDEVGRVALEHAARLDVLLALPLLLGRGGGGRRRRLGLDLADLAPDLLALDAPLTHRERVYRSGQPLQLRDHLAGEELEGGLGLGAGHAWVVEAEDEVQVAAAVGRSEERRV